MSPIARSNNRFTGLAATRAGARPHNEVILRDSAPEFEPFALAQATPNGSAVCKVDVVLDLVSALAVFIAGVANVFGCRFCIATFAIFVKLPE